MLNLLYLFAILLFIVIALYVAFYPKTNCIYVDKRGNKVKTININHFVITLVYILDDGQEVTTIQNWDIFEFIKTFKLWKIL